MITLELAGNTTRIDVAFPMINILLRRQLFQNCVILRLAMMKRKTFLTRRNTLIRQVKNYVDDYLNPGKINVIYPTKDNFTQPLSVKEILDKLDVSKDDYYKALSISEEEDLELHLKREPNCYFTNNYLV